MARSKGPKWYAVRKGRTPGVYTTWKECQAQTSGFSGAVFKSFPSQHEARIFAGLNGTINTSKGKDDRTILLVPLPSTRKRNAAAGTTTEALKSKKQKLPNGNLCNKVLIIEMHFDGGSRGNPGVAGAGAYLQITEKEDQKLAGHSSKSNKKDVKIRYFVGMNSTNNVAEYNGLLQGLKEAYSIVHEFCCKLKRSGNSSDHARINLNVKGDSNLIINQLNGLYQCKHKNMKPLYLECKELQRRIEGLENSPMCDITVTFGHVYRIDNKVADALANEAMDQKKTWTEKTGFNDAHEAPKQSSHCGMKKSSYNQTEDNYTIEEV